MARLTAEDVAGIWAGVTMSWDAADRFDDDSYAANTQAMIDAQVHGIYTTGSTGEFYALQFEEFCRMVDIQAELCGATNMPLQIGCCSDATAKTIRMLEYVNSKPAVGAAQVNLPYWMELSDREVQQFFADLHSACPSMPLVHYNIPRAKRFLNSSDYLRILEVTPNLIGVKFTFAGTHFTQLQDDILATPNLSYFVGENLLASAMQLGARGCYSSLVATDPQYTLNFYETARRGDWPQAIKMQQNIATFFNNAEEFIDARGEDASDPVFDKGLAVASGCLTGHQRCRAPYLGWSDDTITALRAWLKEDYPEFVHPRLK